MKGLKFLAVVGSLSIAISGLQLVSATEAVPSKKGPAKSVKKPEFSEEQLNMSRGMDMSRAESALDAILNSFKAKPVAAAAAPERPVRPVAKVKPAQQTKVAHTHTPQAPVQIQDHVAEGRLPSQLAVYKNANSNNNNMVTVAHSAIASSQTPVISAVLDRPGTLPTYKSGDRMTIKVKALQDCKIIVFDYDGKGTLTQLFPNDFETDGAMTAGQTVELGGTDSKYTLDVSGKGMERIFVYAYPSAGADSNVTVAMAPVSNTPFRSMELTPAQYDQMVNRSRSFFAPVATEKPQQIAMDMKSLETNSRARAVRPNAKPVQTASSSPFNKLELFFQIDK